MNNPIPTSRIIVMIGFLYVLAAVYLSPDLFFKNLFQFIFVFLPSSLVLPVIGLFIVAIARSPKTPLTFSIRILKSRGVSPSIIIMGICFIMTSFWTFKYYIPKFVPFYADPYLAYLDEAIHFGEPWIFLHSITSPNLMPILVLIYFPGWAIQFSFGILYAAYHADNSARARYFIAFLFTIVILGNLIATATASVGPIFYEKFVDHIRFNGLSSALHKSPSSSVIFDFADRLYSAYHYGVNNFFAGISAMPSIHVAVATLNALFLSSISTLAGIAGWIFAGVTLFCSVYFGWHYAIDGYVSIILVCIIWKIATYLTLQKIDE